MKDLIILAIYCVPVLWSCRPEGYWEPPHPEEEKKENNTGSKGFFAVNSSWGGWIPPEDNDDWKQWIEIWGKKKSIDLPESDEWGSDKGPESGWPQHWKGYGPGIDGVPPPPWAYVPESYDKPDYCFQIPEFGECQDNVTRWGFNPTSGQCETYFYSGCGGNGNNFVNNARCISACVDSAAPDCEDDPAVNLEEMVNY